MHFLAIFRYLQISKSILEKSKGDMKKRMAVQGGPTRWSIQKKVIRTMALTIRPVEGSFCLHPLTRI